MEYGFDRLVHNNLTLLFFLPLYSRQFLFLKKQILVPGKRLVICLNCRITILNMKCISIYALVVRSTSFQVMCIKNPPCGIMTRRSIFKHIVRNLHLHVTCVKKIFNSPSALKLHICIYTREKPFTWDVCNKTFMASGNLNAHLHTHAYSNHLHVVYVEILSICQCLEIASAYS